MNCLRGRLGKGERVASAGPESWAKKSGAMLAQKEIRVRGSGSQLGQGRVISLGSGWGEGEARNCPGGRKCGQSWAVSVEVGRRGKNTLGDLMADWSMGRQGSCKSLRCPSPRTSPSPITPLTKEDKVKV